MCGNFPPARISDLPQSRQYPGASGDAFLSAKASMKVPTPVAGLSDDFISKDDEGLFAFIETLRLSVKAKVAEEQQRGLSLSEIVVQVREMVRIAEEGAGQSKAFPSRAFKAISRQALAWCVETYRPLVFIAADDFSHPPHAPDPLSLLSALDRAGASSECLPAMSPNFRGIP
jgi:hypothetical protein